MIIEYVYIHRSRTRAWVRVFCLLFLALSQKNKTKRIKEFSFKKANKIKKKRDKQAKPNKQHQQVAIFHIHISLCLSTTILLFCYTQFIYCAWTKFKLFNIYLVRQEGISHLAMDIKNMSSFLFFLAWKALVVRVFFQCHYWLLLW